MPVILIVDDDDDIRAALQRIFERAGFAVLVAADGLAALDLARGHHPDVVLTDMDMPGLDGVQLCQAIRGDPALADTPLAILSGSLRPGDPRTADAEICGVLLKPFGIRDLVAAMRKLADAGRHQHHSACSATAFPENQ